MPLLFEVNKEWIFVTLHAASTRSISSSSPFRLFSFSPLTVTPLFPFSPGHQINSRYTSSTCFFPANAHWHLHKYSTEEQDEQGVLSLPLASISLLPPPDLLPTSAPSCSHVSRQSLLIKKLCDYF